MAKKAEDQITKTEAVKRAIEAGKDNPTDGAAYIKETFSLDVTPQQFSTYKSIAKKGKGMKKPGRKAAASPVPKATGAVHTSNPADLARQVKGLVETFGADAVKGMVGVFE